MELRRARVEVLVRGRRGFGCARMGSACLIREALSQRRE
jgi:hypothetical protein